MPRFPLVYKKLWKQDPSRICIELYDEILAPPADLRARPPHLVKKKPFIDLPVSSRTESPQLTSPSNSQFKGKQLLRREIGSLTMPTVCLIEFDSNASNVSLCPTNVPQDTIYPLPVDKGEVSFNSC
ncbi:unnamed protein product [Trichobilharzia regenti]|nr:unnamed protein product [Trichobilharzia regenti]